jgi:hypothetical protein
MSNDAFCIKCGKRNKCKVICPELEKALKKETVGRRNWLTIVDPFLLDKYEYDKQTRERGRRKRHIEFEE